MITAVPAPFCLDLQGREQALTIPEEPTDIIDVEYWPAVSAARRRNRRQGRLNLSKGRNIEVMRTLLALPLLFALLGASASGADPKAPPKTATRKVAAAAPSASRSWAADNGNGTY